MTRVDAVPLWSLIGLARQKAWDIVGGLSNPSKMPCYSWGIPIEACRVGQRLMEVTGSTCQSCYVLKGFYRQKRVKEAQQRRLDRFDAPMWVVAMIRLVFWQMVETGVPFFRWFDSGDLQSVHMLRRVADVARETPGVRHWLPTREYRIVREYLRENALPENLVVRVSAPMVDGPAPRALGLPTSTVHTGEEGPDFNCPARTSSPPSCGDCRACWNPLVENVSYPLH